MSSIMVADDSWTTRLIIVKMLQNQGHHIIEAENGTDVIEKIKEHEIDCLVLDLLMPDKDGFEVLAVLKENGYKIPVIVLSADLQETSKQECLNLGAVDFLHKPLREDELLQCVRRAIDPK